MEEAKAVGSQATVTADTTTTEIKKVDPPKNKWGAPKNTWAAAPKPTPVKNTWTVPTNHSWSKPATKPQPVPTLEEKAREEIAVMSSLPPETSMSTSVEPVEEKVAKPVESKAKTTWTPAMVDDSDKKTPDDSEIEERKGPVVTN